MLRLLAAPPTSTLPSCEEEQQSVTLEAEAAREAPEVCVSTTMATTLVFDETIVREALEEDDFRLVTFGTRLLTLVPGEQATPGKRLRLVVRFREGSAPQEAVLTLVMHPASTTRQVHVQRRSRHFTSYELELKGMRRENEQLREELERLRGQCVPVRPLTESSAPPDAEVGSPAEPGT
jgi:uncharacterized protein (TIGR02268 family)